MDVELSEALCGVYFSCKEILKHDQRHLFCNMLSLLRTTFKASSDAIMTKIHIDEVVHFWLSEILPLAFDSDPLIQKSAIEALTEGVEKMNMNDIHKSSNWQSEKERILTTYISKLHTIRDNQNEQWHHIWCLIVRIFDRDILKGASVINQFLTIVELGFRSSENSVRTQAFICWRCLIEIFHKHNELCIPKRLKLICIPLKSSQSRSEESAIAKYRVWWYLIVCMGDKLESHFTVVIEPFFNFVYGLSNRMTAAAVQYKTIRTMAIACALQIFDWTNDQVEARMFKDLCLEKLTTPSPLMHTNVLEKHWKTLVNVAIALIEMKFECENDEGKLLTHHLTNFFIKLVDDLQMPQVSIYILNGMEPLCSQHVTIVGHFIEKWSTHQSFLDITSEDFSALPNLMLTFLKILNASKPILKPNSFSNCVEKFLCPQQSNKENYWRAFHVLIDLYCNENKTHFTSFKDVALPIWTHQSKYLQQINDVADLTNHLNLLHSWILWPLTVDEDIIDSLEEDFCEIWTKLLDKYMSMHDDFSLCSQIIDYLHETFTSKRASYIPIFHTIFKSIFKYNVHDKSLLRKLFDNFQIIFDLNLELKSRESLLELLTLNLFCQKIPAHDVYEIVKPLLHYITSNSKRFNIDSSVHEKWRKAMLKSAGSSDKVFITELSALLGIEEEFTVIPTVWHLDPDRLTNNQKERFSQPADIPELYNDLSPSQVNCLKSWPSRKSLASNPSEDCHSRQRAKEGPECMSRNHSLDTSDTSQTKKPQKKNLATDIENMSTDGNSQSEVDDTRENGKQTESISQSTEASSIMLDLELSKIGKNGCTSVSALDTSPQRLTAKCIPLLSPPDRKQTSNANSPNIRPKMNTHLTGRGAQLINMIRNKKPDENVSKSSALQPKPTPKQQNSALSSLSAHIESSDVEDMSAHTEMNSLLTFTKALPSPTASPSVSILKRKAIAETPDDLHLEYSSSKKKRVSFHDPPVSLTKEYVRDFVENMKPRRCLTLDKKLLKHTDGRYELKRRGKVDSLMEIDTFQQNHISKLGGTQTDTSMQETPLDYEVGSDLDIVRKFKRNGCDLLDIVVDQYPIEKVLDKYFSSDKVSNSKVTKQIARYLSGRMREETKLSTDVLEVLSENHSSEFLDYAIQENISSVVCDRLNITSIIEYICLKCKLNVSCRSKVLSEIPVILQYVKHKSEMLSFLENAFQKIAPNDEDAMNIISVLMHSRNSRLQNVESTQT